MARERTMMPRQRLPIPAERIPAFRVIPERAPDHLGRWESWGFTMTNGSAAGVGYLSRAAAHLAALAHLDPGWHRAAHARLSWDSYFRRARTARRGGGHEAEAALCLTAAAHWRRILREALAQARGA